MRSLLRVVPGLILLAGCGTAPTPVEVPPPAVYDATAMTAAAFAEYDRDKNGVIEGSEIDACPALRWALAGIDTNRDGKISRDELQARFEGYTAANVSLVSVAVTVTLDGAPLADATVQFVPEACMGGTVAAAAGKTGADGAVRSFAVAEKEYAGLQPGLYRVKVTRPDAGGKEQLPARYNAQTTLGAEVFGGRGARPLSFALSSR